MPDWIIAMSTVIYTIATIVILLVMLHQTKLTREIFESSHRPYLADNGVVTINQGGESLAFELINAGSAPARKVHASLTFDPGGADVKLIYVPTGYAGFLTPGQKVNYVGLKTLEMLALEKERRSYTVLLSCAYSGSTGSDYVYQRTFEYRPDLNLLCNVQTTGN